MSSRCSSARAILWFASVPFTLVALSLTACSGGRESPPNTIRFVDLYAEATIEGTDNATDRDIPRTEWKFDETPGGSSEGRRSGAATTGGSRTEAAAASSATLGWRAGPGVAGLGIREGRLAGRTTTDFPLLSVERTSDVDDRDLVHSIEVRLKASAGANLGIDYVDDEAVDFDKVLEGAEIFPWSTTAPIIAGEEMRTYTLSPARPVMASGLRHLVLRPTDAAGSDFEIAWVRVVFRREHLAGIPSGIGWHGLSEVYRETLVSRSPETLRFEVSLPDRPWLDLGLGTIENGPVTFRVALAGGGRDRSGGEDGTTLLERTVTMPHRWEESPIDLSPWAGRTVTLALSLDAGENGVLGFWGSPAIRDLGAAPRPVAGAPSRDAARASAGSAYASSSRGASPPQGVILIWADTLRRDHLDLYGYERETAPAVARMAREGVTFADSHVNGTWTKVSTTSLFTGLYPPTHGILEFNDRLPAAATTLAEVYRDAGYATLSLSSILFTGKFTNLQQGFEQVHESGSLPDELESKTARAYVDQLLPWLEAHREVPFFVFLHVSDPHDPFLPYPPYDTMWGDAGWKEEHQADQKKVRDFIDDPLMKAFGMPNRAELERAGIDPATYVARERDWYDGSIRGMDAEIARLFERLRGLGLDQRTLVVFSADHGEEFLEHGRMFHGQTTYGELANAPLVFWGPGAGIPSGIAVGETTQAIDIMPTLLELSGLPVPDGVQGRSLVASMRSGSAVATAAGSSLDPAARAAMSTGGTSGDSASSLSLVHSTFAAGDDGAARGDLRPAYTQKARTNQASGPPPREAEMFAVVYDGWKLVHHTRRAGLAEGVEPPSDDYELFDTRTDPLNLHDLAPQHPDIVARLAKMIDDWRADSEAVRLPSDAESMESMSHDELERLRSLGYIN